MAREEISIRTTGGSCRSSVFTPGQGGGRWPAVIFFMDALAIRPALFRMAQRLSDAGFVVLLPDLYYRAGPYEPVDARSVYESGDLRGTLARIGQATTDNRRAALDTEVFLDYLAHRRDVTGSSVGTVGYCMGGAVALTVAGTYPERVAATAVFHGASLATDTPLSPHLLVDRIQGRVYIGAADNDTHSYPPSMAGRLVEALMGASIAHRHDLYVGAEHGWCMPDFPWVYDDDAAERHWRELIGLFTETLTERRA